MNSLQSIAVDHVCFHIILSKTLPYYHDNMSRKKYKHIYNILINIYKKKIKTCII